MSKVVSFEQFKDNKAEQERLERRNRMEAELCAEADAFLASIGLALVCSNDDNIGDTE